MTPSATESATGTEVARCSFALASVARIGDMNHMTDVTQDAAGFVAAWLAKIEARETELRHELDMLGVERAKLFAIAKAAGVGEFAPAKSIETANPVAVTRRKRPVRTIKDAIVSVLADKRSGMTALEILDELADRFDMRIQRTSLSPQLSRLKDEGKVGRLGMIWSLITTETNEAPADGDPQGASEPEDGGASPPGVFD
jgi:hypothetical protein